MGAGDVDGDELDDIMVINYEDWASARGSFVVAVPNRVITRHPTLFPSSRPSISTPSPSNFPSSSPSEGVEVLMPSSLTANHTRAPTVLKTKKPSLFPTIRPTRRPSPRPSVTPTIQTRAPSLSPSSKKPSTKPSRSPTVSPSINRQPTSSPSSSPTLSMSQPWTITEISSGGYYDGSHRREIFVVDSAGNVAIRGSEGGRSIYKIVPRGNVTITILTREPGHHRSLRIPISYYSPRNYVPNIPIDVSARGQSNCCPCQL